MPSMTSRKGAGYERRRRAARRISDGGRRRSRSRPRPASCCCCCCCCCCDCRHHCCSLERSTADSSCWAAFALAASALRCHVAGCCCCCCCCWSSSFRWQPSPPLLNGERLRVGHARSPVGRLRPSSCACRARCHRRCCCCCCCYPTFCAHRPITTTRTTGVRSPCGNEHWYRSVHCHLPDLRCGCRLLREATVDAIVVVLVVLVVVERQREQLAQFMQRKEPLRLRKSRPAPPRP